MTLKLVSLLRSAGLSQAQLATGIGKSEALISRLVRGEGGVSQGTINAILTFLTERVGRRVTYEEVFLPGEDAA